MFTIRTIKFQTSRKNYSFNFLETQSEIISEMFRYYGIELLQYLIVAVKAPRSGRMKKKLKEDKGVRHSMSQSTCCSAVLRI